MSRDGSVCNISTGAFPDARCAAKGGGNAEPRKPSKSETHNHAERCRPICNTIVGRNVSATRLSRGDNATNEIVCRYTKTMRGITWYHVNNIEMPWHVSNR